MGSSCGNWKESKTHCADVYYTLLVGMLVCVFSCRVDPSVYRVIRHYTRLTKLSYEFVYGWRHFVEIGLPPVESVDLSIVGVIRPVPRCKLCSARGM